MPKIALNINIPKPLQGYIKAQGLGLGAAVWGTVGEYRARTQQGESPGAAALKAGASNILPALLFTGRFGILQQMAFTMAPLLPVMASTANQMSIMRDHHIRQSALPFSEKGYVPTAAALNAMGQMNQLMGVASGLASTHAALYSMALRR